MVNSLNCSTLCDMINITSRVPVGYVTDTPICFEQVFTTFFVLLLPQDPPSSSTPPVTGYNITHNITGSVGFDWINETILILDDVAGGEYIFVVVAVNALGDGKENNCSITG